MQKVGVGVIGCGSIGVFHLACFKKAENAELLGACDIDRKALDSAGKKFEVDNLYLNYRDLLENEEIDAVSVCLPNNLHSTVSVAAFATGKHVLCEKPPAINAKESRRMVEAAERADKKLLIGLTNRFRNKSHVLKRHIDAGELGEVYYAKCGSLRRSGIPGMGSWFTTKSEAGAGPLYDIGVHALDLTFWFMGNFKAKSAFASTYAKFGPLRKGLGGWGKPVPGGPFDVEDLAAVFFKMENGASVFLEVSWASHVGETKFYSIMLGDKAGADFESMTIFSEEEGDFVNKKLFFKENNAYQTEIEHFIDCIVNDKEPVTTNEEMILLQEALDAALLSAEEGREVKVAHV